MKLNALIAACLASATTFIAAPSAQAASGAQAAPGAYTNALRSEEHTSELQSH